MGRFDGVAGERGVERVDPAFELLDPAFDAVSDAVDANFVTDTESAEGRSVSRRPVSDHHLWEAAVQFLDPFEKPPRREGVSRRRDAEVDDLARRGVECGEQDELLAVLDYDGFVEENSGGDLGDGLAARRRETLAELLDPVPDCDVRAFDADPAENSLGLPEAHTAVVEDDREFDDERFSAVALEELNVFERFLQSGKVQVVHLDLHLPVAFLS